MRISFDSKRFLCYTLACSVPFCFTACAPRKNDLFYSVSELRSNIFLSETKDIRLKIYAEQKESPFLSDGIARECAPKTEIYVSAPSGEKDCTIAFLVNGTTYGGDCSYDNVKGEYFYFVSLDVSSEKNIPVTIDYDGTTIALNAASVLTEITLSPQAALKKAEKENAEAFERLTSHGGFDGEIRLRLVWEGAPYYYVGLVDKSGNVFSILCDGITGKTLATRNA